MVRKVITLLFILFAMLSCVFAQTNLSLRRADGLRVTVINKDYLLLKVLLPNQSLADRGIEIEFPEHVTGIRETNSEAEHLYLVSRGTANKRTSPAWHINGDTLYYETNLDDAVTMIAKVIMDRDGLRYNYQLHNHSGRSYHNLQAVTCVKLYALFADTLLERTYVHHPDGFELLASETPTRLTMGLQQWLPCRYLVSYSWPVVSNAVQKGEDGITRYYKSKKSDKPFIATLSHDGKWVAATYTKETGNLWTNPERSCQHADPSVNLGPGETKTLELKTFIIQGNMEQLLTLINREMKTK